MIDKKFVGVFQISLLVVSVFAFANMFSFVSGNDLAEQLGIGGEEVVYTCPEDLDGAVCQEYHEDVCEDVCKESCVRGEREEVDGCDVGTCIDDEEGMCSSGATEENCEEKGGRFVQGSANEINECQKHCCILGNEAQFVTEKRCEILSERYQVDMNFNTDIYNADICSMLVKQGGLGACVWRNPEGEDDLFDCRQATAAECVQTQGLEVDFHEGLLCSHPDLNTRCEKQNHTACVPGLDGVYWFDSCGNKENIYYVNTDTSWNGGEILGVNDSCLMGSPGDYLQNQATCGNCNRLVGSVCGEEIPGQELNDNPDSGIVCRDLACFEEDGTRRENGETWCVYTTDFGPSADVPLLGAISNYVNIPFGGSMIRAKSAPGGEHFRSSCIEGEIEVEPCGPYRNGICVEDRVDITSSEQFTSAACMPNRWSECLNYNAGGDGALADLTNAMSQISSIPIVGQMAGKALALPAEAEKVKVLNMMLTCEKDPDCFVKTVNVDKDFKFPLCIPKYSPGFYKQEMDPNDGGICGFGSQMCSTVWVKEATAFTFGATAHWECKANCKCVDGEDPSSAKPSRKFVSEMHALCVSLGDCGAKTNYVGDVGGLLQGYELKKAEYEGMPKAPDKDRKKKSVQGLPPFPVDDSNPMPGNYIDAGAYENLSSGSSGGDGSGGGGGLVGAPRPPNDAPSDATMTTGLVMGGVAGATGLAITGLGMLGVGTVTATSLVTPLGSLTLSVASTGTAVGQTTSLGGWLSQSTTLNPGMAAFQGAAIGASIAIAVVSLLLGFSGVGAGVGTAGVVAYTAGAAVGGGMAGVAVVQGGWGSLIGAGSGGAGAAGAAAGATWLGPVGLAIVVIVIVDIIAQWLAGTGEIRTVEVYFDCKPWTAPGSAKCDQCGDNGLPCNQYNCETLGAECQFLPENEGVEDEELPVCVEVEFNDVAGPRIEELMDDALAEGYEYQNVEGLGTDSTRFEVEKSDEDGCVSQFQRISFGFVTDEPAECGYSFEPDAEFESMYSLGGSGLRYQHRQTITEIWEQMEEGSEDLQDIDVYIKCKDYQLDEDRGGNIGGENVMSFCVNPIDLTAPFIVSTNVPEGYVAPHDQETMWITVTFDEHVNESRLDFNDVPFDEMQYEMSCSENVCAVEVPLELGGNTFYVGARDMEGNEMTGGAITVQRSETPLEIVSVTYDGQELEGMTITRGNLLNTIEIVAETQGGVDGTAECSYILNGYGEAYFQETGGGVTSTHRQEFTTMVAGNYNMGIYCVDTAGNWNETIVSFTVDSDLVGPSVSRVYDNSGTLTVIIDEPGSCSYTNNDCGFDFDDGQPMSGADYVQTTELDYDKVYYIKCKDQYDNEPTGCSIIVSGGEF